MALFTASPVASAWSSPNDMFDAAKVAQSVQGYQQNQLMMQRGQQEIGAADQEQVARAAAWINTLPKDQRPAGYSAAVQQLQQNGFAKKAPLQYPGDDAMAMLERQGIPSADQFKLNMNAAGLNALGNAVGTGSAATSTQSGSAGTAAPLKPFVGANLPPGVTPEEDQMVRTVVGEAGGESDQGQRAVAGVIRNRVAQSGRSAQDVIFAPSQFEPWNNPASRAKLEAIDPNSPEYQRALANVRTNTDPTNGATHFYSPKAQAALAATDGRAVTPSWASNAEPSSVIGNHNFYKLGYGPGSGAPGAMAAATPQGQTGAPGTPASGNATLAPVQVAGPGAPTPSGPTAAPGGQTVPPPAQAAPQTPAAPGVRPGGPQPPAPPVVQSNGLTQQQNDMFNVLRSRPTTDPVKLTEMVKGWQTENRAATQQAYTDANQNLHFQQAGTELIATDPKTGAVVQRIPTSNSGRIQHIDTGRDVVVINADGKTLATYSKGAYDLQKNDYERDAKELAGFSDAHQQAQSSQISLTTARDLASQLGTGAGGQTRAMLANIAETIGIKGADKVLVGSTSDAQEFAKLMLKGSGTQERQVLGARGGFQAMKLFQAANPSLDLQPDANRRILNMQLIGAQADADYTQGAMDYANHAGDQFRTGGNYTPISHFDAQWAAQRNPQIYAAAMGAINGDAYDKWSKSLGSNEDIHRVLDILRRADPTAQVQWDDGTMRPVRRQQ